MPGSVVCVIRELLQCPWPLGTSYSNGLIFHMYKWEEKGLKLDLVLKESEFFSFMRSKEKREDSHRKRSREVTSQELLT